MRSALPALLIVRTDLRLGSARLGSGAIVCKCVPSGREECTISARREVFILKSNIATLTPRLFACLFYCSPTLDSLEPLCWLCSVLWSFCTFFVLLLAAFCALELVYNLLYTLSLCGFVLMCFSGAPSASSYWRHQATVDVHT